VIIKDGFGKGADELQEAAMRLCHKADNFKYSKRS